MDDGSGSGYVSLTSGRAMWTAICRRWYILIAGAVIGLALASISVAFGQSYDSTIVIAPAQSSSATEASSSSGLSSLAAIAGLGSGGSSALSAYDQFLLTIRSGGLARALLLDKPLMQKMFAARWDEASHSWYFVKSPLQNLSGSIDNTFGFYRPSYITADDVEKYLGSRLRIAEDKTTSVRTVTLRTNDPQLSYDLLLYIFNHADDIVRRNDFAYLNEQVSYLDRRLETVTNLEHRQQLVSILSDYEKRLMLAQGNLSYASRIIDFPQVAKSPSSPRPSLVLVLGLTAGLFLSIAIIAIGELRRQSARDLSAVNAEYMNEE